MSQYGRINLSKGIDVNKTSGSQECLICHYLYFLKINSKIYSDVCHGCYDFSQKFMNFNDVAVVSVKGNGYRIHLCYLSKDQAISLLKHAHLTEKSVTL